MADARQATPSRSFSVTSGVLKPQWLLKLPLVPLAPGKTTALRTADGGRKGISYPAAIAVIPGAHERLLVAENLSDSVALLDASSGAIEHIFDLSASADVPSTYPIAVAVSKDGTRAFVTLWNASEVAELDLQHGTIVRRVELMKAHTPTAPGSHPCALVLDEHAGVLYVALANRDAIAAVRISGKHHEELLSVAGYFDTRLPGQSYFGGEPDALAENAGGTRLYAANLGSDAVAVIDPRHLKSIDDQRGMTEPIGFVPTELMPTALAFSGSTLYIATDKGKGTGPNNMPQAPGAHAGAASLSGRGFTYAPTLIHGSLASLKEQEIESNLKASTEAVLEGNRMRAAQETITFASGHDPNQACDLHHQGEPHLRSDIRRSREERPTGRKWRSESNDVWNDDYAKRTQTGTSIRRTR